ncbi:hypothetical protein ILYODFUR_022800, partial [Ilyodon furcidens]
IFFSCFRFAVAFTEKLKEEAEFVLVSPKSKIYVQPQGIQTEVAEKFCWTEFLRSSVPHFDKLIVVFKDFKLVMYNFLFPCTIKNMT